MTLPISRIKLMVVSGRLTGGGAERFVSNLLCQLDLNRFDTTVVSLRDELGFPIPPEMPLSVLNYTDWRSTASTISQLRALIDRVHPDVILTNMDSNGKFVGSALRKTSSQPAWIARTSNDPVPKHQGIRGRLNKLWLQSVYPRADFFVANSEGLAEGFRRFFACASQKTRVIGNPVDLEAIEKLSLLEHDESTVTADPLIVFLGRLEQQKRPDVLLEAFRQIVKRRRAKLLICGDGPLRSDVERMISQYQLGDSVRLLGFLDNPFSIIRQASLVISTSDYEGLPNAILEAQGLGIPVVATDCKYGPSEIIVDEVTGLLVEKGQAASVAAAAESILANPDVGRRMSVAARANIREKYGAPKITSQWMQLIESASRFRSASLPIGQEDGGQTEKDRSNGVDGRSSDRSEMRPKRLDRDDYPVRRAS